MKLFDQDLCNNLRYGLNPRVHCAFGNVFIQGLAVQKHLANVYVTFTKGPSL